MDNSRNRIHVKLCGKYDTMRTAKSFYTCTGKYNFKDMKNTKTVYIMFAIAVIASLIAFAQAADLLAYDSSASQAAIKSTDKGSQYASKAKYGSKGGCYSGQCPFSGPGCRCTYRSITKWWTKYCCTGGSPNCQTRHVWNYNCKAIGCC
jgi:hypothetical protein